jgi:D-sorbitol dehydrogenase (acceptor)
VVDINQKSVVFCIQAAAAQMIMQIPEEVKRAGCSNQSYGKIVNFSSISGRRGRSLQVHYAASKAAIISITQSAALAFAPYNININAVSPSVVLTEMWEKGVEEKSRLFGTDTDEESKRFIDHIPLKRAGTPEDMAAAVAFLCSSDADYITGQTLNVDGGFEMD